MQSLDINTLTGISRGHIDTSVFPSGLHHDAVAAFSRLQLAAARAGFDLAIASSFRDFNRQLLIWNEKVAGIRPVYGNDGQLVVPGQCSCWELAQAILRWSALPGASRHHWGTDLDVYDMAAVPPSYQLQLSPAEVTSGGPFVPMHEWLDSQLASGMAEDFFRPYGQDRGGIAVERWHLSYAPVAAEFQQQLTPARLATFLGGQQLALKETLLEHIEEIYQRYIDVPVAIYPARYRWDN